MPMCVGTHVNVVSDTNAVSHANVVTVRVGCKVNGVRRAVIYDTYIIFSTDVP